MTDPTETGPGIVCATSRSPAAAAPLPGTAPHLISYDAAHVALAEVLGIVLVTADARLSRAPGTTCDVDVVR
jgi:predicted nucleic acid-binding protein